jgi:hypothetical protein
MPITPETMVKVSYIRHVEAMETSRQKEALYRLKMLDDNFEEQVQDELKKYVSEDTWKELKEKVNTTVNVFKSVISDISMLYVNPPTRTFEPGKEKDKKSEQMIEVFEEMYKEMRVDEKLQLTNQYLNAMNDVILQVVFRKGKINLDILTPNVVSIVQDEEDLTQPVFVGVKRIYMDDYWKWEERVENRDHWVCWSENEHFRLKSTGEIEQINENDENPYKRLPFVFGHRKIPVGRFWDETSGRDLYKCTLIAACLLTLIDYNFTWHNFKQGWIRSRDELPKGFGRAPDRMIVLKGETDEAGTLDFQIAIKQLYEALREYITSVVQNYGVDWNSMTLRVKEVSGRALMVKNSKLERLWKNQVSNFQTIEKEIFDLIKHFYEIHFGPEVDLNLKVKFTQMETYKDEKSELEVLKQEIGLNLKDYVMAFMERYKGYKNYEEAKEKVLKIIETNNEINAKIEKPLSQILGVEEHAEE